MMEETQGTALPLSQEVYDDMAKAGDIAIAQHGEARTFVMETMGIGGANVEFPNMVLAAMQVLATNYLAVVAAKEN